MYIFNRITVNPQLPKRINRLLPGSDLGSRLLKGSTKVKLTVIENVVDEEWPLIKKMRWEIMMKIMMQKRQNRKILWKEIK